MHDLTVFIADLEAFLRQHHCELTCDVIIDADGRDCAPFIQALFFKPGDRRVVLANLGACIPAPVNASTSD